MRGSLASQYWTLTKPRVVALIVFTAIIGMLLAIGPGDVWPWPRLLAGTFGIWLAAASAAAINHLLDQRIDKVMARTAERPLATGALTPMQVLVFAIVLGVASMSILLLWVDVVCAALTFASLIGYAIVYTGFLKRATPQNIVIGGLAGAAPPLLGWSAVTGMQQAHDWEYALLLVLIIFVWTPPHFWALAIERRDEYAKVDIPMLPVTHGIEFTRVQVLLYTVLLAVTTTLPFVAHMSGWIYLAGSLVLNGIFLYYAVLLRYAPRPGLPMKTFGYSIVYLMGIFSLLLIDHYLQPLLT